jgi:hypothetical protein
VPLLDVVERKSSLSSPIGMVKFVVMMVMVMDAGDDGEVVVVWR